MDITPATTPISAMSMRANAHVIDIFCATKKSNVAKNNKRAPLNKPSLKGLFFMRDVMQQFIYIVLYSQARNFLLFRV